jgi:hypothetical protein
MSPQMREDTSPWMRETPLWKREPRSARAVMLNSPPPLTPPPTRPIPSRLSASSPVALQKPPK